MADPSSESEAVAATARVLAIPELLEAILAHLPFKDLLFAQRVNTTCRDTVRASKVPKQKLHLIPIDNVEPVLGTLAVLPIPPCCLAYMEQRPNYFGATIEVKPLELEYPNAIGSEKQSNKSCISATVANGTSTLDTIDNTKQNTTRESWRAMLVTQPPLKELRFRQWAGATASTLADWHLLSITSTTGITLGQMHDAATEALHGAGGNVTFFDGKESMMVMAPMISNVESFVANLR